MNVRNLFELRGRVAVVTGGSIGLGRQIAQGLAEMGADIVLCARKVSRCEAAARELADLGVRALALECDVTQPESVKHVTEEVVNRFGHIDILVNNAGISWGVPFEEMKLAEWERVLSTNLTGTFLMTQAVGQVMIRQRSGSVVNMASVTGIVGLPAEAVQATAYHASKGAVIAFTKDLACKWAPLNIRVNALAPGWFPTHMTDKLLEIKKDLLLNGVPMQRFGSGDDLKGAAVFLASEASSYVTGQVLVVDGGLTSW
jgi:NAD(P)-dependent dehydrogenase (short-subunit alcohol dehydrogenase family)